MSAWLDGELAAVRAELARVDAKCGVLSAVATGAAAFTATQTGGHGPLVARVILAAAGVLFAAAVAVLLATLRPRLGTAGWCRYVPLTESDIWDLDSCGHTGDYPRELRTSTFGREDLAALVSITAVKFGRLRLAVDLTGAGVVLLAAGVVAGVVT
jgi:hypothetical protein